MKMTPWRWGLGALLSTAVVLVACDGENLFDPGQNPFSEPRVAVSAPDGAFAGDTVGISVSATAAQNVASITLAVRGAATKDTTLTVTGEQRSFTGVVKLALPEILLDTVIYVAAVATDGAGNTSKVRADTSVVLGPPVVLAVTAPDSLRPGTNATVTLRAFGSRRVAQFDVQMRGAVNSDQSITVNPPTQDATQTFTVAVPAVPGDTTIRFTVRARDVTGLASPAVETTAPVAIAGPIVTVTPVAAVNPGGSLNFTINAASLRGVASLRIEMIRGGLQSQTIAITPPQTSVSQPVSIPVPGDIAADTITYRVIAFDRAGIASAPTAVQTVRVVSGVPLITSLQAPDSTRGGQTIDVRVTATSVRPMTEIVVRFRGAVNQDERVPITTTALTQSKIVSVSIPVEVQDTLLNISATVEDVSGALSENTAQSRKTVRVTDTSAPVVTTTATPGSTFGGGVITIRVNARDNVALRQIGYAVINPAPANDTIGLTPTLRNTSGITKDTTFSFTVPSTITPRTLRVVGIGVDASGRRGYSTPVNVTVADSAAPVITFLAPAPNSTLPLNDSVRVAIHIADPTGIQSVSLKGESTRVDSLGPTRVVQRFATKTITFPITPGGRVPVDTTIVRYLNAITDSISEPVRIIATASDTLGNTASTSTTILVGGPRVELRNPLNNAQVVPGGTLVITAFAIDRTAGIDSVRVNISGVHTAAHTFNAGCQAPATSCVPTSGLPVNDSVVINLDEVVPLATPNGNMSIMVTAWNRNRVAGVSLPINVLVSTTAVADTARPQVRMQLVANDRVEVVDDTITVNVAAQDVGSNGIRRMGLMVIAVPSSTPPLPDPTIPAPDTLYLDTLFAGSGRTGLQTKAFKFTLADFGFTDLNLRRLPRPITLQVHAFALDTGGNCGANVTNTLATITCDSVSLVPPPATSSSGQNWWYFARNTAGFSQLVTVVPGIERALQQGSVIADVLVANTPTGPRMFLSNHNNNRIDAFGLAPAGFTTSQTISVGSEPWGLFVNNSNDRLMVANSGGTNISFVDLTVATPVERNAERLLTPNEVLYNILIATSNGFLKYTVEAIDFSDRPQFVGQDANGIILYSTKPTESAPDGSVRYLTTHPVTALTRPDSKIIYNRDAIRSNVDGVALAYVDSVIVIRPGIGNDAIEIFDHMPGTPGTVIRSGPWENIDSAVTAVRALGSDVAAQSGLWDREAVGLSDTTYIAVSGDRQFAGFGEGGVGPFARVWLWRAASQSISDDVTVQDLVGNASERVVGLALNNDGQLGAARGSSAAYYFSNNAQLEGDLRLQGQFSNGVAGGSGGIALHPNHTTIVGCTENSLSFVATVNRSIKIIDTYNFRQRGEILVRDNIVGPLKAILPLAGDNAGILAGSPDEIIVKLYGVNGNGKAVIINVRRRDLTDMTGCP